MITKKQLNKQIRLLAKREAYVEVWSQGGVLVGTYLMYMQGNVPRIRLWALGDDPHEHLMHRNVLCLIHRDVWMAMCRSARTGWPISVPEYSDERITVLP